jgi:hypothetical protein
VAVVNESIKKLCIYHILDGLRDGLSHYSTQSRVGLLYAISPKDPLRIYDPQNLLRGHEPKLKEIYLDSNDWRKGNQVDSLPLAGLISFGGRFDPVFHQMWFTEHHPDMCSTGPTQRWLEHAAWLFSQDLSSENPCVGTSGYVLQEYATHAVRDYIVDRRNDMLGLDTGLRIYPILDAVLGISKTKEEGAWARGALVFMERSDLEKVDYVARFREFERPAIKNFKHARKLLQSVEVGYLFLVSDGRELVGVGYGEAPRSAVTAEFWGGYGFLRLGDEHICSFSDGKFQSTTRKAKLVQLEETLLEAKLEPSLASDLFLIVAVIVHAAQEHKHGCTVVVDLSEEVEEMSGQYLEAPLDLTRPDHLSLAKSLSKVDGALHVGSDLKLHGFACLLDGLAVAGENRARGARFNSALRFTARHEKRIVVVVSSDRPVSIIQGGVELTAVCDLMPFSSCMVMPPTLAEWLEAPG